MFSWFRLRPLNDGHILPALYLSFFSETNVLLNSDVEPTQECHFIYPDKYGNHYKIQYYNDIAKLLRELKLDTLIYLNIDLDFFVTLESVHVIQGAEKLKSVKEMKSYLLLDGLFMSSIFERLVGLIIALEPEFCGGLMNSLKVLNILNQEFFAATLLTNKCRWNK